MAEYELPESPIILKLANLRQAVEWIAFGLKPIPEPYELITRYGINEIQNTNSEEIDCAKRLLCLALFEEKIIATSQKEGDPPHTAYEHPPYYEIPFIYWLFHRIQWDESKLLVYKGKAFFNIFLSTEDLYKIFPYPSLKRKSAKTDYTRPSYLSPYMQLLDLAVKEFNINEKNQPPTKILFEWFFDKLEKVPGEKYHSKSKAKMLATFAREPEAQKGGLKKLNINHSK